MTKRNMPDPDPLDRLEQAFVELEERFKKLPRPPTDRIDMLQYCIGTVRDVRHALQAQPIDANHVDEAVKTFNAERAAAAILATGLVQNLNFPHDYEKLAWAVVNSMKDDPCHE